MSISLGWFSCVPLWGIQPGGVIRPAALHHQHPVSYTGKEAALLFVISLAATNLCLTLPKCCLGNIYSVHSGFVQWISAQSLSPCLNGKPRTFSTWLNCKCPAHGLDWLCNGSAWCSPYGQVSSRHTSAPEGDYTQPSLTGALSQELFTQLILRPSLRDLENIDQQDPLHVLPFLLLPRHFLQK